MKYEFLIEDTINLNIGGRDMVSMYRIKALKDFSNVKKGDLGGYLEHIYNLAQSGNCWIYDNACVCGGADIRGDARVFGDACIYENARISDDARVYGNARLIGNSEVFDNAHVYGNVVIRDKSRVHGKARITGNISLSGEASLSTHEY